MKNIWFLLLLLLLSFPGLALSMEVNLTDPSDELNISDKNTESSATIDELLDKAWDIRNSEPDVALNYALQAIILSDSLGDPYNLVKAHSFSGVAYRLLGDYTSAVEYFFRGLSLAREFEIPTQEAYAYINIANLYIYLEYFSQALENLEFAEEIARQIDDKRILSYIYLNKGRVLMHLLEYSHAIESITAALELRKEIEDIPGQAVCYKYLGDIYFNLDRNSDAINNYEMALNVIDETKDRHLLGNIYLKISQIYSRDRNWQNALTYARQALNIGREVNSRLIIHDALKVLSRVDMETGNFRQAAETLELINLYADTLYNQQLAEKIFSVAFEWEREKQQAQMEILERDKEIQQLRLSRQRTYNAFLIIVALIFLITGIILFYLLRKLKQQNRILEDQKEELKQINAAKDKMFMIIGHDLRGPVWNIKALIELIMEEEAVLNNPQLVESFNALSRSTQSVTDLLENLLFWAKTQDGKLVSKPTNINLNELTRSTVKLYYPWANLKHLNIKMHESSICSIKADENMISSVIRNLLSNAIKYSHKGGNIHIDISTSQGKCIFCIRDNGIGISEEKLGLIFTDEKPFTTKGTGNEAGSGIGLGLCKEFIEKHNGQIWAESTPGKGARFSFALPGADI